MTNLTCRRAPRALFNAVLSLATLIGTLVIASSAWAASTMIYYSELLTSDEIPEFLAPKDIRATAEVLFEHGALDVPGLGDVAAGGLGEGYLPAGSSKLFTQTFSPGYSVDSIVSASLEVLIWDDQFMEFQSEVVTITVDGTFLDGGFAWLRLFEGNVNGVLFESDGEINVRVRSQYGDADIIFSRFAVDYLTSDAVDTGTGGGTGGSVTATPEPGGVVLFYAGALVVGWARTRGRAGELD